VSFDQSVLAALRERIVDEQAKMLQGMGAGECADFGDYRFLVGRIATLGDVLVWIDEIVSDVRKG